MKGTGCCGLDHGPTSPSAGVCEEGECGQSSGETAVEIGGKAEAGHRFAPGRH